MAKIVFLGTGGDAYTVGRQVRGAGGIVGELGGNQFHLDPGPGALPAAKAAGVELRRSVAVLVSHGHLHHAHDVDAVLSAMTYGGLDPHGVLLAASSVVHGADGIAPSLSPYCARFAERVLGLQGVPRVGINTVTIAVALAVHSDPTAVGFQLSAGKERISYTGDTGLSDAVMDAHVGATTLIANMPLPDEHRSEHQLNPADVIALARKVKPKLLILTHFGQQLLKQDVRAVGRRIGREVHCHVLVADDGLVGDTTLYR